MKKNVVLETTYPDKEVTKTINETVGKSFSIVQRLKLGGIGSHRIQILETREELSQYINPGHSINNLNIELRPKGILIHLKRRTETFAWVIQYQKLLTEVDFSRISDGEEWIKLKNATEHNASFIRTLLKVKQSSEGSA